MVFLFSITQFRNDATQSSSQEQGLPLVPGDTITRLSSSKAKIEQFRPTQGGSLCQTFLVEEIQLATENFDERFRIGEGGFGKVYKGIMHLRHGSHVVAIKRADIYSTSQGAEEFSNEITVLSSYKHTNILTLIGYCHDKGEMALVYEYMSLGSLYSHLQRDGGCPLSWVQRLKICIGVARGLEYLHNGLGTGFHVIHHDVKSSNILLDQNWEPKIADFGLSMISPLSFITTHVAGTIGYVDPHYCKTGILTKASDLYGFGIVLLELLCGRVAYKMDAGLDDDDKRDLARWARACIAQGTLDQIIDSRLRGQIMLESFSEFTDILSRCVHFHPEERPTITQVLKSLEFALDLQLQDSQRNSLQPARIMTQSDPSEKCSTTLGRPPKKSFAKSMKRFFNTTIGGRSGTKNDKHPAKTNTTDEKSHSVSSIFKEPRTSSPPLPRLTCATSQLCLPSSTTSTLSSQVAPEVPTQVPDVSSSIVTADKIQGSPTVVSECSASPFPNLTISAATSAPIVMPPENCKCNKVFIGGIRVQEEYEKIWTKILSLHPDILSNIRVGSDMIKSAAAEEVSFLISTIAGRSAMELEPSLLPLWTSKLEDLEYLGVDVEPLKKKQKEMTLLIDEIRERKDREENTRTVEACHENLERVRAEFEEAKRLYEKCVKDMEIANTKSTTLRDRLKERCDALCVDNPAAIDISKDLAEEYM